MKQTILHINIHGNQSDVGSHHQEPGCRCFTGLRSTFICGSGVRQQRCRVEKDVAGQWGRGGGLTLLANSNNHKITFLLSPSHTKRRVFFPSSAPSSFFFVPQPHTIVNTMMAALKHWSGFSEQDRTIHPVHFMLNIALASTV